METKIRLFILGILITPMLLLCSKQKDEIPQSQTSLTKIATKYYEFSFADMNVGYLYWSDFWAHESTVYVERTNDGGKNWKVIYTDTRSGDLNGIIALNQDTCLVLSNYTGLPGLYRTYNGGGDWNTILLNGSEYSSFVWNYTLDGAGNLIVAMDGNAPSNTYKLVRVIDDSVELLFRTPDTLDFEYTLISFPTVRDGYILIKSKNSPWLLYYTHNSGKSWDFCKPPKDSLMNSLTFTSANTGYAAYNNGYLYRTIDGGLNWTQLITNTTHSLNYIQFLDDKNGFCTGNSGTFLITHDGLNWRSWETGFTGNIGKIQMLDTNNGYMATSQGLYKIERK